MQASDSVAMVAIKAQAPELSANFRLCRAGAMTSFGPDIAMISEVEAQESAQG